MTSQTFLLSAGHVLQALGTQDLDVEVQTCCGYCQEIVADVSPEEVGPNYRRTVDAAIAELRPGVSFRARAGDSSITGTLDLSPEAMPNWPQDLSDKFYHSELMVNKVGWRTGPTAGFVSSIDMQTSYGSHLWDNQLQVTPVGADDFSLKGDSGAVIFTDDGRIVGLLVSGENPEYPPELKKSPPPPPRVSTGSHIRYVLEAFNVQLLTNAPAVMYRVGSNPELPPVAARLHPRITVEGEWATAISLVTRHLPEVRSLLDRNRAFALAWHRSRGSAVVQLLGRLIEGETPEVPREIGGVSWSTCVNGLVDAARTHGSEAFSANLELYRPVMLALQGRSREEALGLLLEGAADRAPSSSPF